MHLRGKNHKKSTENGEKSSEIVETEKIGNNQGNYDSDSEEEVESESS